MTRLHLLGTGGFHPTEERHTACLMLPSEGIVLDAGTAFFRVRDLLCTDTLDVLLTHPHLDHCIGLTYLLDVLWQKPVRQVRVFGDAVHLEAIRQQLFGSTLFPSEFKHELCPLTDERRELGNWQVRWRRQKHEGTSLGFRLDGPGTSLAYITDLSANPNDRAAIEFVQGVDVLVHECYFPDALDAFARRTCHSSASNVAMVAADAKVGRLILVHANPLSDDDYASVILDSVRAIFPNGQWGQDRQIVELPGPNQ